MSVTSTPPIYMLNNDILLEIFTINGNVFSNSGQALFDTRRASQVCSKWRTLMINTPSIWARLLDSDELYYISGYEWENVLLRRSEDALLWIRVHSNTFKMPACKNRAQILKQFFVNVIQVNWYCIQKLSIDDSCSGFGLTQQMLFFPAPQLVEFDALLSDTPVSAEDSQGETEIAPIFGGNAPLLRKFSLKGHIVDWKTRWLSHISFLELNTTYGVDSSLAVLSATRNLQYLKISDLNLGNLSTPLPRISLPHLQHLHCHIFPRPATELLNHIALPLGCVLTLDIVCYNNAELINVIKANFLVVIKVSTHYVIRYLHSHLFDILHLDYTPDRSLSLKCMNMFLKKCLLSISLPLHDDHHPTHTELIFDKLVSLDMTLVICLELRIDGVCFDPFIGPFLDNLQHLKIIHIDSNTLSGLMFNERLGYGPKTSTIFFPFLQTLVGIFSRRSDSEAFDQFERYTLWRARNGFSITTLDLTRHTPFKGLLNLDALKDINGLKVLYKCAQMEGILEYTCGSTDPISETSIKTN